MADGQARTRNKYVASLMTRTQKPAAKVQKQKESKQAAVSDPEKAKKRAASQQAAKASFFRNFGRVLSNPADERNTTLAMVSM